MYDSSLEQRSQHHSLKIGFLGSNDSGKSTLVSVLTKGKNDDGRGSAKNQLLNHAHQGQKSINQDTHIRIQIMGFSKQNDQIFPKTESRDRNTIWPQLVGQSNKIISLIDFDGHDKYLKKTISGLFALSPDIGCLVVCANLGIQKMTRQHIKLCLYLQKPFFIVLNKTDKAPSNKLSQTVDNIYRLLKHPDIRKTPILIDDTQKTSEQIDKLTEGMLTRTNCPIFSISCVNKSGIKNLIEFISKIKVPQPQQELLSGSFVLSIFHKSTIKGVGLVVSGTIKRGYVIKGQICLLGPDKLSNFMPIQIKSIHLYRRNTTFAQVGNLVSLCIAPSSTNEFIRGQDIRRGMMLIDNSSKLELVSQFEAQVQIVVFSTQLTAGYEDVFQCGVIEQIVILQKIIKEDKNKDTIRTGEKGVGIFKFKYWPELVSVGQTFFLREKCIKIVGKIVRIVH